jgi:hypothetical protein
MNIVEEKHAHGINRYHQLDNGTCYNVETPVEVVEVLEKARESGLRIRIYYGDQNTGRCWMDEYDTIGTIGRSTGRIKIPLLIKTARSLGGGAVLDSCIIRIDDRPGHTVYQHQNYHTPALEIAPRHGGYGVNFDYCGAADFKTKAQAERYVAFMKGERWSK